MNADSVTIAARFEGPPGIVNGGYACGTCAAGLPVGRASVPAVEVTLRKPVPYGRPLERRDGKLILDGEILAEAVPAALDLDLPPPVSVADAVSASAHYVGLHVHAFPRCFVCGPDRADGLRLFPGAIDGHVATPWTPDPSVADGAFVAEPCVWAALDCPTYWGAIVGQELRVALLGRLTVEIRDRVRIGEPHVVVGWPLGIEGRKIHGAAAILDASGRWLARSKAVWIELRGA